MDGNAYILYNVHLSQNSVLLIFFSPQPFKNVKIIISLWVNIQKWGGRFWSVGQSLLSPGLWHFISDKNSCSPLNACVHYTVCVIKRAQKTYWVKVKNINWHSRLFFLNSLGGLSYLETSELANEKRNAYEIICSISPLFQERKELWGIRHLSDFLIKRRHAGSYPQRLHVRNEK